MNPHLDPHRASRIVTGVLKEALRASGRVGVVVSGGGPEATILLSWLDRAGIPRNIPSDAALEAARTNLLAVWDGEPPASPQIGQRSGSPPLRLGGAEGSTLEAAPDWDLEAEASALAGAALARPLGLLHLGTANKTCLLLSWALPTQPVLPLGDVYASQVRHLVGSCTLPPCLRDAPPGTLQDVDGALRAYLEEGFRQEEALGGLAEPLRREVLAGLARARKAWHPLPLIPKLSGATLGLDLDL